MKDVFVQMVDFKCYSVREAVTEDAEGNYIIFINSRLSPDIQKKAYLHALKHVQNDDFNSNVDISTLEYERHRNEVI